MARDGRSTTGICAPPLPSPETKRWVPRRKAEIVAAVEEGILTLDEACKRYSLSAEEFLGWKKALERHGLAGLRRAYVRAHGAPPMKMERAESAGLH